MGLFRKHWLMIVSTVWIGSRSIVTFGPVNPTLFIALLALVFASGFFFGIAGEEWSRGEREIQPLSSLWARPETPEKPDAGDWPTLY